MAKKVLLIEDDPFIADIYLSNLREAGFETDFAENGAIGLEKIEKNPDLIILDMLLPDISGFEILKEIKNLPKKIPVIILTNLTDGENVKLGQKLGAVGYFNKTSLFPDQLIKKVKKILRE